MNCLVTGAAGFIGSHLCRRLLKEGFYVTGIDSFTSFYPKWIKERNIHFDGARVFNASVASGIPVKEYAKIGDSMMFCLSKGQSGFPWVTFWQEEKAVSL